MLAVIQSMIDYIRKIYFFFMYSPDTSHFFFSQGKRSRSYKEVVTPSIVPNSLPSPSESNMRKKTMDQNGAEGPNSLIA